MKWDQFWADVSPFSKNSLEYPNAFEVSGSKTAISYKDSSLFKIVILKKNEESRK